MTQSSASSSLKDPNTLTWDVIGSEQIANKINPMIIQAWVLLGVKVLQTFSTWAVDPEIWIRNE